MAVTRVILLTCLLTLTSTMDFHAMEDNCILSFVVPRDKVKSSCDMEERVTRRLNAMETKVTLYKQHVQELQEQLSKERQLHQQQLEDLNQRLVLREEESPDPQLDKRLQGLEEELRKVRTLATSSPKPTQATAPGEKPNGRGAGLTLLPAGRSREEEEKAITVLVKSVVHSEVKKLFDNYTHYVGRYVRDQALAFNQIINMVPRTDPSFHHLAPQARHDMDRAATTPTPPAQTLTPDRDTVLLNQLDGIRSRLSNSSLKLADRVHDALHNLTTTTSTTTTTTTTTTTLPSTVVSDLTTVHSAPSSNDHDLSLDINDASSGDINDRVGEHSTTFTPTSQGNETEQADLTSLHSMPTPSSQEAEALSAKSRMSYNAELNKLPEPSAGGEAVSGVERSDIPGASNVSGWKESMVHDQSAQWLQELLKTKLQEILQQQVDEVLSLVLKHSSMVDSKLHDTQLKFGQLEQRLGTDIKHLNQMVSGMKLELGSVSEGLQTVQGRLASVEELEDTVQDLKKNVTQEGGSRLLATLLDEQGKKVRKMERLTDIYKQSLEHYRNETKLEYRGLKERLEKEAGVLRALDTDLWHNVTQHAAQLTSQLNQSATAHMDGLKHRVKVMEDNSLLQQIDMSNFERQMKSKTSKAERDLNKLNEDVEDLKQKARSLQKNLNTAITNQNQLEQGLNATSAQMQHLQIEVQLEVLDEWVPFNFDYMKTRTDCFGDQYIRKSEYKVGRLVGVVLCNQNRYKIFLGQSLVDTFKNIGDDSGMGEDHCQFVNARSMSQVKVSPFRTSTETEPGYVRTHWGQEPRPELLNIIRPSPVWYECGVSIP